MGEGAGRPRRRAGTALATAAAPHRSKVRVAVDVSAIPEQPAGAGVYVLRVVEALDARADVALQLVAATGDVDRWRRLAPGAEVHAVAPAHRPVRLAWEQTRAPAVARRLRCDVWHGPHYTMPLRSGVPTVVTIHDLTFFDHPEWHERSKVVFFRRMTRVSAMRGNLLLCVSEHTARRLRAVLNPEAPVVVVPHGVDHHRYRPVDDRGDDAAVLARVGVRRPFVAFAGTLEPRKNVPSLVRAFARVAAGRPDLTLVLAGQPGWGADEVRRAVADSGVGDRIVQTGYVDDHVLPALFRRAEAVAYPSREEGFGLPALEAMACGAPLVTTTGSAMEDVAHGAALLVPPDDDDALTDALGALLAGGADVDRLRAAGPAVAARYTWAACAERHVEAYRRTLEPASGTTGHTA